MVVVRMTVTGLYVVTATTMMVRLICPCENHLFHAISSRSHKPGVSYWYYWMPVGVVMMTVMVYLRTATGFFEWGCHCSGRHSYSVGYGYG